MLLVLTRPYCNAHFPLSGMAPARFRMFVASHMSDISVVHYLGVKPWMCTRALLQRTAAHSVNSSTTPQPSPAGTSNAILNTKPLTPSSLQVATTACLIKRTIRAMRSTICGGSTWTPCVHQHTSRAKTLKQLIDCTVPGMRSKRAMKHMQRTQHLQNHLQPACANRRKNTSFQTCKSTHKLETRSRQ